MKSSYFALLFLTLLTGLAVSLAVISPKFLKDSVTMTKAEDEKIENNLSIMAKGMVESEEEIEIGNQVMGIISEVKVKEGDKVIKGQLLVRLDDCKILTKLQLTEAKLKDAKAKLRELEMGFRDEDITMAQSRVDRLEIIYKRAKDEYERQKRLYHKEASTLIDLEKAEDGMKITRAELSESKANLKKFMRGVRKEEIEGAKSVVEKIGSELSYYQAVLKDYTIHSPIDGLVAKLSRNSGESVDVGAAFMKIIDPDKLRIRAELEESDVGKVVEGQPVEVFVDAYEGRVYKGMTYQVFSILKRYSLRVFDPSAGYDINAQDIFARLDDFSGLKHGMQVTVSFKQMMKDEINDEIKDELSKRKDEL